MVLLCYAFCTVRMGTGDEMNEAIFFSAGRSCLGMYL